MAPKCNYLPAKMDKRVAIQTITRAEDGQGGFAELWDDAFSVWASFEPANGYERFRASQQGADITHKVVMRYRNDIGIGDRIRWGTRLFDIKEALNEDERGRYLKLRCAERARLEREAVWGEFAMAWERWDAVWSASIPYADLATRWNFLNTRWESMD